MKKILLITIIIVAAYGQNYKISTVKVKETQNVPQKEFFAKTSFKEASTKEITLKFSGFVEKISVDERYKKVEKGSLLFTVYSPEILALKEELIKTAEYAEKSKIFEDEIFSKTAASLLESTKQRLYLLGVSKTDIEKTLSSKTPSRTVSVYSLYSGTVVEKSVFAGSFVEVGRTLMKLSDTSTLWADIKIYESDIPTLKIGSTVILTFSGATKEYKAKINQILPEINENDRSLTARASLQNDGHLVANMFAKARIQSKGEKILTLPKTAVLEKGKKQFVFVKVDNKFEPFEITAKKIDAYNYQILEGITQGEEVANNALFMLDADAKINGLY
jgi:Cu(I)/Ag(I) efflux system membrane fusion protein